ncbi:hypothetical protein ABIB57_000021 [Devosia sp. UYZn731]|uniref:DUF4189 domain-containing protein n=1 Tax=Devosia sp. UYZn731 TaxID=3156345 RepID=UPI003391890D
MKKYFSVILVFICLLVSTTPTFASWAVAVGSEGTVITARGYQYPAQAKAAALKDCNARYTNCAIVESSANNCFAMADDGTHWGFGQSPNEHKASEEALAACSALTTRQCAIVNNFCGR